MSLYIIANPHAGRGRSKKVVAQAEAYLQQKGLEYTLVWTDRPGQATQLAAEAAKTHPVVVSAGGDGTMREVAIGLIGTQAALGVLPCGTGNDYYHGIGMPEKIEEALDLMASGQYKHCDVGYANEMPFFNITACGLDMDLYEASLPIKKYVSGLLAYLLALLAVVPRFRPHPMQIAVDDQPAEFCRNSLTTIAISPYFGGGMKPAPGALVDDGFFNVAILHDYFRRHIPFALPRFIIGKHITMKRCKYLQAQRIRIESEVPLPFEVDGDCGPVADLGQPVEITICKQQLRVVRP